MLIIDTTKMLLILQIIIVLHVPTGYYALNTKLLKDQLNGSLYYNKT